MNIPRSIIIFNIVVLFVFGLWAFAQRNGEFIFYLIVAMVLALLIGYSSRTVKYPAWVLWLLSAWLFLHMAGGLVPVAEGVLYSKMLVNVLGEPYNILKYDQAIHFYGFFVATVTMWYVLKPSVKDSGKYAVPIMVFLMGIGLGAINEVVEFLATVMLPNTNVGGYVNTGLDLVANTLGATLGAIVVQWKLRE